MSNRAKRVLMACAVPVLILAGMCATPLYTLYSGEEIILQTRPLDPSDPLRGDYVSLQYEAEEVPVGLVEPAITERVKNGESGLNVYVTLEKKNGIDVPAKVTMKQPDKGTYLKGTIDYIGVRDTFNGEQTAAGEEVAYIQYSLDKYFVADNTGTKWEEASAKGEVLAKAKVHNGYAVLTDILVK